MTLNILQHIPRDKWKQAQVLFPIKIAPSEFTPHFSERLTEFAPYSIRVKLCVSLTSAVIHCNKVFQMTPALVATSHESETRIYLVLWAWIQEWMLGANSVDILVRTPTMWTQLGAKPPQFNVRKQVTGAFQASMPGDHKELWVITETFLLTQIKEQVLKGTWGVALCLQLHI